MLFEQYPPFPANKILTKESNKFGIVYSGE
jgi:hypothetical protein